MTDAHREMPRAVIFGCAGPEATEDERAFFRDVQPTGYILFARNIVDPDQVRRLCGDLRDAVGDAETPILIDQEGGRVARLGPPHWPVQSAASRIGAIAAFDPAAGARAAWLQGRLIADDLMAVGITVDCAPVADVPVADAHDVIGDRAYSSDPKIVGDLARAMAGGLLSGGVLPVVKHTPGHGRARADSHVTLPTVDVSVETLSESDFVPFVALADLPWAMTAHVVYSAIDPDRVATLSPIVIGDVIRGRIGFEGVLISDDLSMKALGDGPAVSARAALDAGCDLVLHCNGDMAEMVAVADAVGPFGAAARARLERARAWVKEPDRIIRRAAQAELDVLLADPAMV